MAAAWEGHADVVKLLLKHGARSQATNAQDQSALSLAESVGHGRIAKLARESLRERVAADNRSRRGKEAD